MCNVVSANELSRESRLHTSMCMPGYAAQGPPQRDGPCPRSLTLIIKDYLNQVAFLAFVGRSHDSPLR